MAELIDTSTREMEVTMVLTRADGTVYDLGTMAYYHKNPFKRFRGKLRVAYNKWKTRKIRRG